jgi:hypothetical protein
LLIVTCHISPDVGGGNVKNGTRHSLARIPLRWMIRECFLAGTGIQFHRSAFSDIGMDPSNLYPFVTSRPAPIPSTPELVEHANIDAEVDERTERYEDGELKKPDSDNISSTKRPAHHEHTASGVGTSLANEMQADRQAVVLQMSEEEEEIRDALTPSFDALQPMSAWWILEFLPIKMRVQNKNMHWTTRSVINRGGPRAVPASRDEHQIVRVHRSVKLRMDAEGLSQGKYVPRAIFPRNPDGSVVEPTWVD